MREECFDFVIVGAGSAGCVLANRLSARRDCTVALIEAGGRDRHPWLRIPAGGSKLLHDRRWDWCYRTEAEPRLGHRSVGWPRGKVLGGSSAINGLVYLRGRPDDYNRWQRLGNPGWGWHDVLPYFVKSEDQERGPDALHGVGGPLPVSDVRARRDLCDAFIRGAEEIGIPAIHDLNGEPQEGAAYFQLTTRRGVRASTAAAFLRAAESRASLRVITHAHVECIHLRGRTARGVRYYRDGEPRLALAAREVILACGSIGSPQLLQLSGIGPAPVLQRAGVPIVHALPGVGANLQDHLQIRAVYRATRPTLGQEMHDPIGKVLAGVRYLLTRGGPLSVGTRHVGVFSRSRAELDAPDLAIILEPASTCKPSAAGERFSAFTVAACQLRPASRGRVELKSPDPYAYPAIRPNYLDAPTDRRAAVDGLALARRLCATRSMAPFVAAELRPGPDVVGEEALLAAARAIADSLHHAVGTCKMGPDPMAVVDARLRVHGIERLRVADASIMPTIPSGGTNAPTIMIAEKAAELILADLRR